MKKITLVLALLIIIGCGQKTEYKEDDNMKLLSHAFENNGDMPSDYTCDGDDVSPEIFIEGVPENAKSLVLIMDDPDAPAGIWDHWIVFNIPANVTKIERGEEPKGTPGTNSWGRVGYGGPCPPSGTHRYYFKVYALDEVLELSSGASKKEIEKAMEGHIVAEAQLMGKYTRS